MLARDIVNKLLAKFESSKSFVDPTSKRKVELLLRDPFFDGYRNGSHELDIALETIKSQDICDIRYQDDYLERIILRTDSASLEKSYAFAGRSNPKQRLAQLTDFFHSKKNSESGIVRAFAESSLVSLGEGRPGVVENAYGTIEEIKIIVKCVEAMEKLEQDVPERVFSSNLLGDSKAFALHKTKIAKLIRDYAEMGFEEDDDPVAAYGVIQNRTYAFIKGNLSVCIGSVAIDLAQFGHELALSDEMINELQVTNVSTEKLFTVENLTSFNEFPDHDAVVIYLGGFHNAVRRRLIQKIQSAKPDMQFFHYGDIDAGGLYILNHLREKTGIHFLPYMMDKATLEKYFGKRKRLTKSDKERLAKMKLDPRFEEFVDTIEYMLAHDAKLEQEAEIDF